MQAKPPAFVKINIKALKENKPLEFDLYDRKKILMLPRGHRLTHHELEVFRRQDNLYRIVPFNTEYDPNDETSMPVVVKKPNKVGLNLIKVVEYFALVVPTGEIGKYEAIECPFIGYIDNIALICEIPRRGNRLVAIMPGDKVLINMIASNTSYSFQSTVSCVAKQPVEHMFVMLPKALKETELRKASRIPLKIITSLTLARGDVIKIIITDLSSRGVGFTTEYFIPDKIVEIALPIDAEDKTRVMKARCVVHNSKKIKSTEFKYGAEFVDIDAMESLLLQAFIYTHS